jgi:hypothetical protein
MSTDATLQDVSVKKINLAGFVQYDFKLFKLVESKSEFKI